MSHNIYLFRSGTFAISTILNAINKNYRQIFVPSFCCNTVRNTFIPYQSKLYFYDILNTCKIFESISSDPEVLFVVFTLHDTIFESLFISTSKCTILYDSSQSLLEIKKRSQNVIEIKSITKTVYLLRFAIVVSPYKINTKKYEGLIIISYLIIQVFKYLFKKAHGIIGLKYVI